MDASEASCSSRNVINEGPTVAYGERRGRESVHESNASASGGSNTPLATVCETHTTSPGNAIVAIKLNPTLPRNGSMSVIQSPWIQRLKPFAQSNTPKEEPAKISTKETPICTHFTKDFSSCSRRLNKTSHHTRSSSWRPHAMQIQGVEHFPLELGEPAGIAEGYGKAAVISPNVDHQSIRAPSNIITHSSDANSRMGNLFAQQQSRCKQISAIEIFVPSAVKRENSTIKKLNDLEESERGGDCKPKDWLTQQIQNSVKDFKKAISVGECKVALHMEAIFQTEEAAKKWDFSNGSCGASTGDGHAPRLSVSMYTSAHNSGASADADDRILFAKPLDKTLPHRSSFVKPDCEVAFPIAAVSEDRINTDKAGEAWCPGRETTNTGVDAKNFGCVQTAKNFKQFKESVGKPYLLNNFSDIQASNKFHSSSKNSYLAEDFCNAHERVIMTTWAAGSGTVAASGSLKPDVVPKRLDGFYSRENDFADLQGTPFSEGGRIHRSNPPIGSFHEDAARSRIREKSLGDYWNSWVSLLEGPDYAKAAQTGSPMAKLQQDYVVGEYDENLFQPASSNGRLDAKQKFEDCHSHKHVSYSFGNIGGCDLPQQRLGSSSTSYKFLDHRMSSSHIKMVNGQERYASADRSSHFNLKDLQSSQKHGATNRVDLQPHDKEADLHRRFLDDGSSHSRMCSPHGNIERTGEKSSMHQGWIRRWHSSAKFSAMSGKTTAHVPYSSRSSSSNQLVKSNNASAQCPLMSNHKAMGSLDQTELGSGSSRYMDISGVRLDSGSGSTTPSPLAGRNFAAFRSGYMGPCTGPMRMVRKSASKPPPKSLKTRGFCGLPCTYPKFVECKVLPEDEKVHSVDSDASKALEHHIDDL